MSFDILIKATEALLQPNILIYLLVGVMFGFIIGAIPGFNDTNVLAMLLPFTIYFGATQAVIFMMAVFAGAQAAGPIPAILMNMPGTPSAAACCLDGYALTRKGMAKKALGTSLLGSLWRNVRRFGLCVLEL